MLRNHSSLIPASTVSYLSCYGNKPVVAGLIVMQETWKQVKGYENIYEVSDSGRVKSCQRKVAKGNMMKTIKEKIFSGYIANTGYYVVNLSIKNKTRQFCIHRLVAEHFIDNPDNKNVINHIDGNKLNNRVDNLEWCTYSENNYHAYRLGLNYGRKEKPSI